MRNHPAKPGRRTAQTRGRGPLAPRAETRVGEALEPLEPASHFPSFVSFHYSSTQVSLEGNVPRVRARHARFENGKLTTESFDGELTRAACARILEGVERLVAAQLQIVARTLAMFAPSRPTRSEDRE